MNTVICSHGFGVGADSRGMFPEIAAVFPELRFVMFDYNTFDEHRNATVESLEKQAAKLNVQIEKAEQPITLLCHSQGCVVASLANLDRVEKLIFLAPPDSLNIDRISETFMNRLGAMYNENGMSVIPRRDGTTTYLSKDYIDSVRDTDVQALFKEAATKKPLVIIRAGDDEIIHNTQFPEVPAQIITIAGDHNFTGEYRKGLIETLHTLLD